MIDETNTYRGADIVKKIRVYLAVAVGLLLSSPGKADLIVTVGSASINESGTGTLDVLVSSTGSDAVQLAEFQLLIEPSSVATPGTYLSFVDPGPNSPGYVTDPGYLFAGNSDSEFFDIPVGGPSTTATPGDTFAGLDATADLFDVSVGTTPLLLARLGITAGTGVPPVAGDIFTVSLVPSGSAFEDSFFDPVAFSGSPGTVTVVGDQVAAVPEPSTMLALGLGLAAFAGTAVRRRRRAG